MAINPQTTRLYTYLFQTLGIGVLRDYIQEWRSPDFHRAHLQPFIWMPLLTLAAIGFSGQRADLTDMGLVSGFAYLALLAGRNIALFALIDGPVLTRYARPALTRLLETVRARWNGRRTDTKTPSTDSSPARAHPPFRPGLVLLNWALLGLVTAAALLKVTISLRPATREKEMVAFLPVEAVRYL
ncbi:MAG: hypothetical protein JSV36_03285 [Anaerolineae bacterium]|nr:MAG: hypothetical protein JSV36_03285 [Anaerolineae bacterium]